MLCNQATISPSVSKVTTGLIPKGVPSGFVSKLLTGCGFSSGRGKLPRIGFA